jgi:hypothetical protein
MWLRIENVMNRLNPTIDSNHTAPQEIHTRFKKYKIYAYEYKFDKSESIWLCIMTDWYSELTIWAEA